ncbi:MAG: hypothetical protein WCV67_18665 [Victivallaceae bacterium]|jgi:DNA polymerase III sliding clamp (beta) subunit (PCNA family)
MLLINKTELAWTLTVLSRVAPVRDSTLPVLKCAKLQTIDRQTVSLTVTNLDEFFTCRIKVSDAPEGLDTLLPIPEVKNFIKGNKRALLQIEPLTPGGVSITEFADNQTSKQEFPVLEAKAFPIMPPCPEVLFSMQPDFIQALSQVVPSISLADTRMVLHGILLTSDGIVTTNGKELCCIPYDLPVNDKCILRIPDCLFNLNNVCKKLDTIAEKMIYYSLISQVFVCLNRQYFTPIALRTRLIGCFHAFRYTAHRLE